MGYKDNYITLEDAVRVPISSCYNSIDLPEEVEHELSLGFGRYKIVSEYDSELCMNRTYIEVKTQDPDRKGKSLASLLGYYGI